MNKLFCIKLYRLRFSSSTNSSSQDSSSPNNSYLDSSYPETVHTQNSSYLDQFIPGTVHTLGQFIPWDSSYPENSYLEMNFQGMNCPGDELSQGMNCPRVWTVPVWTVLGMNCSGYELTRDELSGDEFFGEELSCTPWWSSQCLMVGGKEASWSAAQIPPFYPSLLPSSCTMCCSSRNSSVQKWSCCYYSIAFD